jgi:cell division protein FtsI (penicillin-binding protein 3)
MNPKTGEILAMANEPTFNANQFARFPQASWRNRAVQNTYEPGSTFKIVTVSAAIEEKVMPLDTMIDTNPGIVWVGGRPIDEYDGHNYHVLSLSEVILKSSNVGAVKIGLQIGTTRLSRFVDRYGFGRRVSPDFRGEHPGIVWKAEQWTESALASVSMGYQVAVTPLQMAAAFSSIANGGEYVEPRVVRAVYRDGRRLAVQPRIVGRTISEETAAVLTTIMERVVEKGTATRAQVAGYTIAGKTGTAEQLIDGHYSKQLNNASFGGFLPSRNPELAIMVVVNAPTAGGKAGGMVAAPIFRRIAEAALRHRGIAPTINPPAPVLVARRDEPTAVPTAARMPQAPAATRPAFETPPGTMPDLTGLSLRDANRRVAHLGIDADLVGDGVVISQSVEPGTLITPGLRLRVALDRARPRPEVERLQP